MKNAISISKKNVNIRSLILHTKKVRNGIRTLREHHTQQSKRELGYTQHKQKNNLQQEPTYRGAYENNLKIAYKHIISHLHKLLQTLALLSHKIIPN
jgi:hypothetical protein